MKISIIILAVAIVVGALIVSNGKTNFGGVETVSFYTNATNSSSSVPMVATTTNPILSLDMARTNAIVCNNSANTLFLHQKGQATTTGVVLNEGIPLYGVGLTTSTKVCQEFPGFKGYLYGIGVATSVISVSSWQ